MSDGKAESAADDPAERGSRASHGRHVAFSSDGSGFVVLVQADPAPGFAADAYVLYPRVF